VRAAALASCVLCALLSLILATPVARAELRPTLKDTCARKQGSGGWGGIRTPETLARLPVFKTGAFNHSATHPFKISIG
jgi:hypothetical protein